MFYCKKMSLVRDPVIDFVLSNRHEMRLDDFEEFREIHPGVFVFDTKLGPVPQKSFDLFFPNRIRDLVTCIEFIYRRGPEEIKDLFFIDIESISQYKFISALFGLADTEGEFPLDLSYDLIDVLDRNNHDVDLIQDAVSSQLRKIKPRDQTAKPTDQM